MANGYAGKIAFIDLTTGKIETEMLAQVHGQFGKNSQNTTIFEIGIL